MDANARPTGPDGFPASGWAPPPEIRAEMAKAGVGPGSAPAAAPAPAAPAAAEPAPAKRVPEVRDLSGRPLSEVYDLEWPREVDGVEIRQVEMRRLSTGQVGAFVDAARAARAAGRPGTRLFPIYYRADGALLSDDEWDALDPDDTDRLGERGDRFLPAIYRSARASDASPPSGSATTGSSSPSAPAGAAAS